MDRNLASIFGTVVGYSSQWNSTNRAASNLIDGRPANQADIILGNYTAYATDGLVDQWVIIDLGEARSLSGFALWGSAIVGDICVKDYRIALDNDASGSFANVVVNSQISAATAYFGGQLLVQRDYQSVALQSARYVKLFLDTNHGHITSIETMELEIIGPDIQQETNTFTSSSEIYDSSGSATVTSDGYIVPASIVTEIVTVTSNAEITDKRTDIPVDAFVAINVRSDAHIAATEAIIVQSDAMVYRSGSAAREIFTMGKGSFVGFPDSGSTLVYCTHISSSDEVIVADMITSSVMDMADVAPPLGYQNYGWKYDWVVRTYDAAQYKFEIRTGETTLSLLASTFSPIVLGQIISIGDVPRYHQWRCHVWASGSGDFELHQFSIKGYVDHPVNPLYSSLNSGEFTTVSNVATDVTKPYEPMDMSRMWGGTYIPGDADGDGIVDYSDLLYIISYLYTGGSVPTPIRRADVNDDSSADIGDITYLLTYLLLGGAPPYRWDESGLE